MSRFRSQAVVSMVLALALLLAGGRGSEAFVLCVHTDGETALETGADRCCLDRGATADGESQRSSAMLETASGGCPGCTDLALSAGAQQPSRVRHIAPPALTVAFLDASTTVLADRLPAAFFASAAIAASPPLALALRI